MANENNNENIDIKPDENSDSHEKSESTESKDVDTKKPADDKKPEQQTHQHHVHNEHPASEKKPKSNTVYTVVIVLGVIVGLILLYNVIQGINATNKLNDQLKDAKDKADELAKPVEITLYLIRNSECKDCIDLSELIAVIKKENVKVVKEEALEYKSEAGKALVEKYGVKKIPTVIIMGNSSNLAIKSEFDEKEDALVFTKIIPPYTDVATGNIKGMISSVILIDKTCKECFDFNLIVQQLRGNGVFIDKETSVDVSSDDGKALVVKYKLTKVPALIMSKDAGDYELIKASWPQIGKIAEDGSYLLDEVSPPYKDLATGKIMGIVDITYLTDNSCATCYNVSTHKTILERGFNMKIAKENYADISDAKGKELVQKYNISSVPTVILSKDASAYKNLVTAWTSVGTKESDESFVFRQVGVIGPYKDLIKNEVVTPQAQQ